jgi:hypothetical protein
MSSIQRVTVAVHGDEGRLGQRRDTVPDPDEAVPLHHREDAQPEFTATSRWDRKCVTVRLEPVFTA